MNVATSSCGRRGGGDRPGSLPSVQHWREGIFGSRTAGRLNRLERSLAFAQLIFAHPPKGECRANYEQSTGQAEVPDYCSSHHQQARKEFHSRVLDWYLKGQDILDALRAHPDTYAKVKAAKSHRESFLVTGIVSGLTPQDHLMQAVNELRAALEQEVHELHRFSSESLAFEAVADWLLRCPLDFPEVANA